MSQWTHVAGCIRIDSILPAMTGGSPERELIDSFGYTCDYDDPLDMWDRCNVPRGSEGSVKYRVERTGRGGDLAWGLVYVWGDLRDYDNVQEIFDWLKRGCKGQMVRSCCVKIDVEYQGSYLVYNDGYESLRMTELETDGES